MTTRREYLLGTAGVGTVASLGGCLGVFGDDDQSDGDDPLITGVADPSAQIPPVFFSAYQYRMPDLLGTVDPESVVLGIGTNLLSAVENDIEEVELSDIERLTGSKVRSRGIAGGGITTPAPSGESIVFDGDLDAGPFEAWLDSLDIDSLTASNGYERYANERESGGFGAFAISDGTFIAMTRSDVDITPEQALSIEIEQGDSKDAPIADSAPPFGDVVRTLDEGSMRLASAYALVPLGMDTGTEAFDDVLGGVVGSGLSVSLGSETALQRAVSYLDPSMASESGLTDAFTSSDMDALAGEEWSTSSDGPTVSARTTVESVPASEMLRFALPIAGYENFFTPVDPTQLGRSSPPIVFFQPDIDDGTLTLEHIGGNTLEDLLVRYVHDGEPQEESWEGEVTQGDQFTSAESIDGGTQGWVVWRPDTVDAAVISRFETPN